jgi:hypothetical protein
MCNMSVMLVSLSPLLYTVVRYKKLQFRKLNAITVRVKKNGLKGTISRDFVVCFLVSFDRSDISTHQEWVLLILKVSFCIEFFDFRVRP